MICVKAHVPVLLKEQVVLAYESCGIQNISWFEDEDSSASSLLDDDELPLASFFFVEGYTGEEDHILLKNILFKLGILDVSVHKAPSTPYLTTQPIEIPPFFITSNEDKKHSLYHTLYITSSTAFGSGDHPTTQGCLTALASIKDDIASVADIGCGSGILAIACSKLWPHAAIHAVDCDPESVTATKHHSIINESNINVCFGYGISPLEPKVFDVVVSNILKRPLQDLALSLIKSCNKYLVLSGFLKFQLQDLKQSYFPLVVSKRFVIKDWVTLILEKETIYPSS